MNYNANFLNTLSESFHTYLKTSARSNEKLKILHSTIAQDLENKLGQEFFVFAYNIGEGKEKTLKGSYYDKKVDIAIFKNNQAMAGVAVKFVMSNYLQNSNNYFEAMLGETANLRTNHLPYFQILIIPEIMPYFNRNGKIIKNEELKESHLHKYLKLSQDNEHIFYHTPNKTLLVVVQLPDFHYAQHKNEYIQACQKQFLRYSAKFDGIQFEKNVILNDYAAFLDKVFHAILAS